MGFNSGFKGLMRYLRLSQRDRWSSSHPIHETESIIIYYKYFEGAGCYHLQGVFSPFLDGCEDGGSSVLCNIITYIKIQMHLIHEDRRLSEYLLYSSCKMSDGWCQSIDSVLILQCMYRASCTVHYPDHTTYSFISIQPLGRLAGTRTQSGERYGSVTLHPGQVLRGRLSLLSPAFRRSHLLR